MIRIRGAELVLVTVRDDATLCEWLSDVWELREDIKIPNKG